MVELIETNTGALTVAYATIIELKWTGEFQELLIRVENTHGANSLQYRIFGAMDSDYEYRTELLYTGATDFTVAAGGNDSRTIEDPWPYIRIQARGVGGASSHTTHISGR